MAQKPKNTSEKKTNTTRTEPQSSAVKTDTEYFKRLLLEKRHEIVGNVNEMENEALKKSRLDASGDLSCMPIHMADLGSDNFEQEFALGLMDTERKILQKIDAALERIDKGTYGTCQATGKPITIARLEARPWAKYCVEHAQKLEQGVVSEEP